MGISTEKANKNKKTTGEKKEKKIPNRGKTPVELMNETTNKVAKNVNKEDVNMKDKDKKVENPETLENIMDPKPSEIMKMIKSKKGEAIWRISFAESTTAAELKEFLAEVPDDTLIRVAGRTDGFAQMDTTYPDLNFCVPEEQGDCENPETTHMNQHIIDFSNLICRHLTNSEDYRRAVVEACNILGQSYEGFAFLAETFANSKTETVVEVPLLKDYLQVVGLTESIFFTTDDVSGCCDDGCIMRDKGFNEFLQSMIHSDMQKRKTLSRVERIVENNKLHLVLRSKKKGKKIKNLSDEELEIILKEIIPEGVSGFRVTRRSVYSIDVEYSLNVKNPFGKRPKKDEITEVYCDACECDGCDMMESCDGEEVSETCEETEGTVISGELHDAQCIRDDEDDD